MAEAIKGSLEPKVVVPLDALQEALEPASPSAQTADLFDVTGGGAGEAQQATYDKIQAAPLEAAQAAANDDLTDKVGAAVDESYTNYIIEALNRSYDDNYRDFDPSFDGTRHAIDLIHSMGLEASDSNLEILGRAGTQGDQIELAQRMQRHQTSQEILSRHGGYALASGVLDPTQLLVDFSTFGASKALKLGRLGSASLGAGGGTAMVGAADISGKSTSGFDYLLNASMQGGALALFGGKAANNIASGKGNWYGKVSMPNTDGRVTAFLSETDKLAATPEATELLKTLVDDPVRRSSLLTNDNAASLLRRYGNEADGLVKEYDDMLEAAMRQQGGYSWLARKIDASGKYTDAKDTLNKRVAEELLRRDADWSTFGRVNANPNVDPLIAKLADQSDKLHGRLGELAKEAGVRGFENFTARPGYFHRSWNDSLFRSMDKAQPGIVRKLLTESAFRGIKGIDHDEADAIAGAMMQRVKDKASGMRSEFMGALGKADTAWLREALDNSKMPQAKIDSIMLKIEQKASDQGTTKYGKHRLTLDMGVGITGTDGQIYRMTDLIDTDLDRVIENYSSALSGRSALAKAGIAGDDAELEAFKRNYLKSISALPQQQQEELMLQLDGLLGDFTGNRPAVNVLGSTGQRVKSIADATMLSASGLWQAAEYATMAQRHGIYETGKQFFKQFPGVRQLLKDANGSPDLADELHTILNLDLARDVRIRPWKRQHDAFLESSDTAFDRILHSGKQMVPFLNGMKYIHAHQARMNANLVLNKFARAAKGDQAALDTIMKYAPDLDWPTVKAALDANVTYTSSKNASSMNWAGWSKAELDSTMNVALRMMDDSLLYGRAGQGASFARSREGQLFGQFRSYVSFAHNKLLRGTLQADGPKGLASLLAFQYPLTFLMVSVNEARKGELDLSDDGLKTLAKKSVGYTAGLGFVSDAAGILGLTGGRGGLSTPVTAMFDAPGRALGGLGKIYEGEYRTGAADIGKASTMVLPFLNVMPGTAMALDALKGE